MIKPGEIQQKARAVGVRDQQIEKDYILSWILKGIAQHEQLSKVIVFKGGTALKKIYFEDYRFSEDLDFTLINNDISNEQIFEWFRDTFEYIKEEANIPLEIIDNNDTIVFVYHGAAEEDALVVKAKFSAMPNVKEIFFGQISPSMGVHTGPGLIGIGFMPAASIVK